MGHPCCYDPPAMWMRLLRFLIGLALVPCGVAASLSLVSTLNAAQPSSEQSISPSFVAFAGGFACWVVIFVALPQPTRAYVFAHELTHALWAKLFGKKVLGMKVGADSGAVVVSETNFLITLAPYFFPLYTVLAVLLYYGLAPFVDVQPWWLPWLALVGASWSFHVTFTLSTLMARQSDILACGRVFSYAFIYLMNVISVSLWIVLVSEASAAQYASFLWEDTIRVWTSVCCGVAWGAEALTGLLS